MKAALICPGERPALNAVSELMPLPLVRVMGKPILEYWLDHLFDCGARKIYLVVTEAHSQIKTWLAESIHWEMEIEWVELDNEPSPAEIRAQLRQKDDKDWLAEPEDVVVMNCLPGAPDKPLFDNYSGWFAAVSHCMPNAASAPDRIGLRQIKPGVWAGLRSRISDDAILKAPCWIGEDALIGPGTTVGPAAIIEDGVIISSGAQVSESFIAPHTRVGELTEICHSLVFGNHLINWHTGSCITVDEPFLLCDIQAPLVSAHVGNWIGGAVAATKPGLRKLSSLYHTLKSGLSQAAAIGPDFAQRCAMEPAPIRIQSGPATRQPLKSNSDQG